MFDCADPNDEMAMKRAGGLFVNRTQTVFVPDGIFVNVVEQNVPLYGVLPSHDPTNPTVLLELPAPPAHAPQEKKMLHPGGIGTKL